MHRVWHKNINKLLDTRCSTFYWINVECTNNMNVQQKIQFRWTQYVVWVQQRWPFCLFYFCSCSFSHSVVVFSSRFSSVVRIVDIILFFHWRMHCFDLQLFMILCLLNGKHEQSLSWIKNERQKRISTTNKIANRKHKTFFICAISLAQTLYR